MPPCQPPRHAVLNLVLPCWGVGVYEVGGYEQEGTDHTLLLHYREKKNEDLLLLLLFTHHIMAVFSVDLTSAKFSRYRSAGTFRVQYLTCTGETQLY